MEVGGKEHMESATEGRQGCLEESEVTLVGVDGA